MAFQTAGDVVWERTFGGAGRDTANSVAALADGGLAVAGLTYSKGAGRSDMWVLRLDGAGSVLWERTFGGAERDTADSVVALADGGLAVAGWTDPNGDLDGDMWVLRLDGAGDVVWERTFGGAGNDSANSITALAGGGLAVAGSTRPEGTGNWDMLVLRLDGAGDVVWERTFGGEEGDHGYSVAALAGGGLAVVGYTQPTGAGRQDMRVLRLVGGLDSAPAP